MERWFYHNENLGDDLDRHEKKASAPTEPYNVKAEKIKEGKTLHFESKRNLKYPNLH